MHSKILKTYIIFLVLLGMFLNGGYFYINLIELFNQKALYVSYKQELISSLVLNLSWVFLYIWFILEPLKRSFILVLSAFSMLLSHGLFLLFIEESFSFTHTLLVVMLSLFFVTGGSLLRKQP